MIKFHLRLVNNFLHKLQSVNINLCCHCIRYKLQARWYRKVLFVADLFALSDQQIGDETHRNSTVIDKAVTSMMTQ